MTETTESISRQEVAIEALRMILSAIKGAILTSVKVFIVVGLAAVFIAVFVRFIVYLNNMIFPQLVAFLESPPEALVMVVQTLFQVIGAIAWVLIFIEVGTFVWRTAKERVKDRKTDTRNQGESET